MIEFKYKFKYSYCCCLCLQQVTSWHPELIEIEDLAKQVSAAGIQFMVADRHPPGPSAPLSYA